MKPAKHTEEIANQEYLGLLAEHGHSIILDALTDPKAYTRGGRLNMSSLARLLGVSANDAKIMLDDLRNTATALEWRELERE